MQERRTRPRMLCADLVEVEWRDKTGRTRRNVANLEDISIYGVCVQLEQPIARGTALNVHLGRDRVAGSVRYCVYRDFGYFMGIEFASPFRSSRRMYQPLHLLDPQWLVKRSLKRTSHN